MSADYDKIFEGLPSDLLLASYELIQRIKKQVLRSDPAPDDDYVVANGLLEAFYEANDWKVPSRLSTTGYSPADESADKLIARSRSIPRLQYEGYVSQIMANYREVNKQKAKAALNGAIAKEPGYAILTGEEKKEIHVHIERIRTLIDGSGLDDRKKNALLDRLTELAAEVNRNGTRTDRFFAFFSEFGFSVSQFTNNAKPAIEEVKAILRIVYHARARHDGIKLPPGDDIPLLPDPDTIDTDVSPEAASGTDDTGT